MKYFLFLLILRTLCYLHQRILVISENELQETTASVLTAALAAKNSEASTSRPSDSGSSSLAAVSPADDHIGSSETTLGVIKELVEEEKGPEQLVKVSCQHSLP